MATEYPQAEDKHISEFDYRLRELKSAYDGLGSSEDFDELLKVIHGNGWTTLTEIYFMNRLVDEAESNVQDALRLRKAILEGARAIAEASAR